MAYHQTPGVSLSSLFLICLPETVPLHQQTGCPPHSPDLNPLTIHGCLVQHPSFFPRTHLTPKVEPECLPRTLAIYPILVPVFTLSMGSMLSSLRPQSFPPEATTSIASTVPTVVAV